MNEEDRNITYTELYDLYNKMYNVLNGGSYHQFLKDECGIELYFKEDTDINLIIRDKNKYLVSKLKYGF